MYLELVRIYRKPSETYAPPGHPEEFSIVLNKNLCINWSHTFGNAATAQSISIEEMSFFANTLPGDGTAGAESTSPDAVIPEDATNKRKGKPKGLTLKDLGME